MTKKFEKKTRGEERRRPHGAAGEAAGAATGGARAGPQVGPEPDPTACAEPPAQGAMEFYTKIFFLFIFSIFFIFIFIF